MRIIALWVGITVSTSSSAAVLVDRYSLPLGSPLISIPNYDDSAGELLQVEFSATTHIIIKGRVISAEYASVRPNAFATVGPYITSYYLRDWFDPIEISHDSWFLAGGFSDYASCNASTLECTYERTFYSLPRFLDSPKYFRGGYFNIYSAGEASLDNEVVLTTSAEWSIEGTITYYTAGELSAAPESSTWLSIILGFGSVGASLRRHQKPKLNFTLAATNERRSAR